MGAFPNKRCEPESAQTVLTTRYILQWTWNLTNSIFFETLGLNTLNIYQKKDVSQSLLKQFDNPLCSPIDLKFDQSHIFWK